MDPFNTVFNLFINYGSKFIDIERLTPLQEKFFQNKTTQYIMFFCVTYLSTRDFFKTCVMFLTIYLFIYVLFNENSKYNILSTSFLYEEGIINNIESKKKLYYETLANL